MRPTYQRGLSLVELLIAMTLSLLLMAGVLQVFLASKNTYLTNMTLAELQENGRFALDAIAQDLRNAGFKGACLAGMGNGTGSDSDLYSLEKAGVDGAEKKMNAAWAPAGRIAGTGALLVRYSTDVGLTAQVIAGDTVTLAKGSAIPGARYVLSDQRFCRIVKNASEDARKITADISLDHFLETVTEAYPYRYAIYWIGTGTDGSPALFITDNSNKGTQQTNELVSGVANMSLRFGVRAEDSDAVGQYKVAGDMSPDDWPNVLAVQISLLLQSSSPNAVDTPMSVVFDGTQVPDPKAPDHRMRLVVGSTVATRNYLP
ncbi:PilW family protein [Pseudomonas sp. QE6]|uniref:PilW family protein n=1 Tax=Pseudomonas sp. QE6 TaxID=3242491 RepID=UPI0035279B0B